MKKRFSILVPFALLGILFVLISVVVLLLFDTHPALAKGLIMSLVFLVVLVVILFFLRVYVPLSGLMSSMASLARGKVPGGRKTNRTDELGFLQEKMNELVAHLARLVNYANDLSEGREIEDVTLVSEEDQLGASMVKLRDNISKTRKEMNERHVLDEQQNWAAQGLAKFSQLVRNTEHDIETMSNEFIREVVHYLDVELGALFLLNEEDEPVLRLTGAYAFDRHKHVARSFRFGEGLVGRCAIEKETIEITDVPPDYIQIRSGMGEDLPAMLLLVPVLMDQQALGVIEIASFQMIPAHKIEFLRSLSNTVASVLIRRNASTIREGSTPEE
jgi:hypothetical protein